jgi:RHS repeat-associated protein
MSDGTTGSYTYHYDNLNRLTSEDQPGSRTISYTYDASSNLLSLADASGTTNYTYNNENLVATLLEPGASTAIQFTYDPNGNRSQIDYPNGVSEYIKYDPSQRIASVVGKKPASGTVLTAFCYSYAAGQADTDLRQSVTNVSTTILGCPSAGTAATTSYGYDGLGRLAQATTPSNVYQYLYDTNGNMCARYTGTTAISLTSCIQTGTGITNYTVNGANQLTNTGNSFDLNGSQTADPGVFSSQYNKLDQTSQITPAGGNPDNQTYTGLNQAQRVSNGAINQINDQLGLNQDTGAPNTYYTRDPSGSILGERHSGNYYFLHDGLGSIAAVTDSSGSTAVTYAYDPYGNTTCSQGTSSCNLYEPIRYAGGYWDQNTSTDEALYKFGERYYDPTLGRWTQPDPINNPLDLHGWNGYDYAGDDPINATDSSGMCSVHTFLHSGLLGCLSHRARRWMGSHQAPSLNLRSAFSNFGESATGFLAGEASCYIAVEVWGGAELGPAGWIGGAFVCGFGGTLIYHDIRSHLRSHR